MCADDSIIAVEGESGAQWQLNAAGDELVSMQVAGKIEDAAEAGAKPAGAAGSAEAATGGNKMTKTRTPPGPGRKSKIKNKVMPSG